MSKEEGLKPPLAFSGVYLGEPTRKTDGYVPTATELRSLQARCRSSNDQPRWLLALINDTGLRLSEALGLSREDVFLDIPHPYVVIEPKPWRRLKMADSDWFHWLVRLCGQTRARLTLPQPVTCFLITATGRPSNRIQPVLL